MSEYTAPRGSTARGEYKPHLPMRVTLRLTTVEEADRLERRSGARRVDGHTVACRVERQRDILAWTTGAPVQGEEEAGRD